MRFVRPLLLSLSLLLPLAAGAAPITFVVDHGGVTAGVSLNGTTIAVGAGQLTSGFVVFDDASGTIPDFSLQSNNLFVSVPALPGAYNALDLDISIDPAAGYSSSATGSNPYTVTLGPIAVSFSGAALDNSPPVTVPPQAVAGVIPINSFTVTAYYDGTEMRLGLLGVKVGEIRFGNLVYDVRADIEFVGFAIPEPALASLLAVGVAGLALASRKR